MQKRKILIVDDSEINRAMLIEILSDHYEILEAKNGVEALRLLRERESEIILMMLDIVMPGMDGFELLSIMQKDGSINRVPTIMISSEEGQSFIDISYNLGAMDYICRPFSPRTVLHRVKSTIAMVEKQNELSNMVTNEIYEKEKDNRLMIDILANIVEFRNGESGLHVVHIRMLTELLLKDLIEKTDRYPISKADIPLISNASALHDIGKITIPESILNKPGKLTQEEFEVMKSHSIEGAKLLSPEPPGDDAEPLIKTAYQICRWHHERYDGRGYPDGLRGEEIPIVAQVVALADVYDALTSKRVYKDAYSHKRAVEMILRGECGAFNPLLLDCFVDVSDELKQCMEAGDHEAHTDEEIRNFAEDIKGREALDVSAQVFRQLEHEQQKNRFFANHSGAIQFDYSLAPEMLTLSSWGANYLGLPETILNPRQDTRWSEIFSKDQMLDLARKLRNTSTRDPLVEQACELFIDGQKREGKVVAQAMWTSDETPRYEGAVGEIRGI